MALPFAWRHHAPDRLRGTLQISLFALRSRPTAAPEPVQAEARECGFRPLLGLSDDFVGL
jgi:hypothetical protein